MMQTLEAEIIERLTGELMAVLRAHYHTRPAARETCQEVLNALGNAVAIIAHGTGSPENCAHALGFFEQSVKLQLQELKLHQPHENVTQ